MINVNYKRLGEKIKKERLANSLTQAKLAEKVEISPTFLGQIERGERVPSLETVVNIAITLNITIDGLLCESELSDAAVISELSLALSKMSNSEKTLLIDIIRCFLNRTSNQNS